MSEAVELRSVPAQPIDVLRGRTTQATLSKDIRALFDQYYARPRLNRGLNVVLYSPLGNGAFEIACGTLVTDGANSFTPAGDVATVPHFGPYDQMRPAHLAIQQWARDNSRSLAGPSWEVYGHWTENPSELRTDIFYLLA